MRTVVGINPSGYKRPSGPNTAGGPANKRQRTENVSEISNL